MIGNVIHQYIHMNAIIYLIFQDSSDTLVKSIHCTDFKVIFLTVSEKTRLKSTWIHIYIPAVSYEILPAPPLSPF